jgi:hypothetical protein
MPTT